MAGGSRISGGGLLALESLGEAPFQVLPLFLGLGVVFVFGACTDLKDQQNCLKHFRHELVKGSTSGSDLFSSCSDVNLT